MSMASRAPRSYFGIDPGTAYIGWALIDPDGELVDCGIVSAKDDDKVMMFGTRLALSYALLTSPGRYTTYVIEEFAMMGMKASVINAFQMGRIVQLILDEIPRGYLDRIKFCKNRDVRTWLCGNARVKPSQVKEALVNMGYTQRCSEHVRDALALALYARSLDQGDKA